MRSIAVYSLKGGVGKTTIAVNLAWAAAALSSRRTLLWDLDPQAAASFLLEGTRPDSHDARAVFSKDIAPAKLVRHTGIERLDLLPADRSLRGLDHLLFDLGKKRRLEKLLERVANSYDRIILDCPPGLTETSEQVLRAADLIVVPLIPSPLSQRALDDVIAYLDRHGIKRTNLLPHYNMADRRRSMHLAALEANPRWPVIPMASALERMATEYTAVGEFAARSPATSALASLWRAIERRLARAAKAAEAG
jgi:cellulose biosynthesis protein BcsQ